MSKILSVYTPGTLNFTRIRPKLKDKFIPLPLTFL